MAAATFQEERLRELSSREKEICISQGSGWQRRKLNTFREFRIKIPSLSLASDGLDLSRFCLRPSDELIFVIQPCLWSDRFWSNCTSMSYVCTMFPINCFFYPCSVNWILITIAIPRLLPYIQQRVSFLFSVHSTVCIWPFAHSNQ